MFGEPSTHRGGQLRAQCQMLGWIPFVEKVEHFLGDDISRLAEALENAEIFEYRRHDFAEPGQLSLFAEGVQSRAATPRLGGKDVAGAFRGTEGRLGHEGSGYRCEAAGEWWFQPVLPAPGSSR